MILEHELTPESATAFIDAYPLMSTTGWKIVSATQIQGLGVYLNSKDSLSPVQKVDGVLGAAYTNLPTTSSVLPSSTIPAPIPSNTTDTNTNTSQSNKNGSIRTIVSKFAGGLGVMFLTIAFYAW